jgi:hypothetical protein
VEHNSFNRIRVAGVPSAPSFNPSEISDTVRSFGTYICLHSLVNISICAYIYIHKHRQIESWHLLTVFVKRIFEMSQTFEL